MKYHGKRDAKRANQLAAGRELAQGSEEQSKTTLRPDVPGRQGCDRLFSMSCEWFYSSDCSG